MDTHKESTQHKQITFKAKPESIWIGDCKKTRVKVPQIEKRHCNMEAFRTCRRFGPYANSDLFPAMIRRELSSMGIPQYVYADKQINGVALDTSGFLWTCTITIKE